MRLVSLTGTRGLQPKKQEVSGHYCMCPSAHIARGNGRNMNTLTAVRFFPGRWHITGKLLNSTSGKLDEGVRDNSIKCSCWKDQAFWCWAPTPTPNAEPWHGLKSTMTKLTAVDWGRGIEENQVPAHILIPALPYHRSDRTPEPRTDTGTAGVWGGTNVSFSTAKHPASAAVWKHNSNENPIDRRCFPFRQIVLFSLAFRATVESKDETPGDIIVSVPSRWADLVSTFFYCTQSKKKRGGRRLNWQLCCHQSGGCGF